MPFSGGRCPEPQQGWSQPGRAPLRGAPRGPTQSPDSAARKLRGTRRSAGGGRGACPRGALCSPARLGGTAAAADSSSHSSDRGGSDGAGDAGGRRARPSGPRWDLIAPLGWTGRLRARLWAEQLVQPAAWRVLNFLLSLALRVWGSGWRGSLTWLRGRQPSPWRATV